MDQKLIGVNLGDPIDADNCCLQTMHRNCKIFYYNSTSS